MIYRLVGNESLSLHIESKLPSAVAGATIRDVAAFAAVSTATVSRALNSPQIVNSETLKRVLRAVEACHYVPNEFAQSLGRRRRQM